eukprot:4639748-Amphidinium_carterae.1
MVTKLVKAFARLCDSKRYHLHRHPNQVVRALAQHPAWVHKPRHLMSQTSKPTADGKSLAPPKHTKGDNKKRRAETPAQKKKREKSIQLLKDCAERCTCDVLNQF